MRYMIIILAILSSLSASTIWQTNYHEAIKIAKKQDKRIYMFIVSDDCRWCDKFERTTLVDKRILKRLKKNYIVLHLVRDKSYIPRKFKTSPIPRHYFLTKTGKIVFPVVGYRDVESFNIFLDDVEARYKKLK